MSIETPSQAESVERMKAQKLVAKEMLGFNPDDLKEQTPEHDAKFLNWIIENGLYFKNILEQNPDIWERICKGTVRPEDIHWIKDQLRHYDLGAEDHESEREFDA